MYNHQLDTFIKVADAGSFSKASEELYVSPNAVMKQINSLESRVGVSLFERTYKGLTLTPAGQSIYKDAKYIVQYTKDAVIRAQEKEKSVQHIIKIGTSFTTPVKYLFSLWFEISKIQPNLKFELISFENNLQNAREIMMNFGNTIDLVAGIYSDNLLKDRRCYALKLYTTPLCCIVPIGHHLSTKYLLTLEDIKNETIMMIKRGYMNDFDVLRNDLLKNNPTIEIEDFSFFNVNAFNYAVNKNQILIGVSEWSDIHPMMKVIPVDWEYTISFGILHSPQPSQDVEIFLEAVKQLYKK